MENHLILQKIVYIKTFNGTTKQSLIFLIMLFFLFLQGFHQIMLKVKNVGPALYLNGG